MTERADTPDQVERTPAAVPLAGPPAEGANGAGRDSVSIDDMVDMLAADGGDDATKAVKAAPADAQGDQPDESEDAAKRARESQPAHKLVENRMARCLGGGGDAA